MQENFFRDLNFMFPATFEAFVFYLFCVRLVELDELD